MPSSMTYLYPACFTSSANAVSAGRSARRSSTTPSQPSHLASSAPVQTAASPAQRSRSLPVLRQSSRAVSAAFCSSGGSLIESWASLSPSMAARLSATAPSSLSAASANQLHAVLDELQRDAGEIEPGRFGVGEDALGALDVLDEAFPQPAVVAERVHGGGRNGVDGVAPDQLFDIHHVAIGLVLHPGAGPQQPLRQRAFLGKRLPARRADQLQVGLVSHLGVGDGDLAAQGLQLSLAAGVDLLVDYAVDAADEEAGDAGQAGDRVPGPHPGPRARR